MRSPTGVPAWRALGSALRPRQWTKNVLVAAVPLAAGELQEPDVLRATIVAFVAFCAVASATYLLNDVLDVESDRAHPVKRDRAVARGDVSRTQALVVAAILCVFGIALAVAFTRAALVWTLIGYAVVTIAYSSWLKHEPVLELALLASGFLLRAIAGGAATGIPVSQWFLIVAGFGSLFMAAGKRFSELVSRDEGAAETRRSLAHYTPGYLRFVWSLAATVSVLGYCLWAFEVGSNQTGSTSWAAWSVLPFVLAVLRYGVDIDAGRAEAPEDVALRDRPLQVLALLWLVLFALGAVGV
jgi:decaprenyl-phosphate phosphoribosyltransferase